MAGIQIDGANQKLYFDSDADTYFEAGTDDTVNFYIAGASDFQFTANTFSVLTGSAVDLADSCEIQIGTGDDLKLYHDGSNSYITNAVGALKIATETSGIALTIGHTTSETTVADNLTVTGTTALTGVATFSATPVFPDGSLALADLDIDGGTEIGAAIVDADLFIIDDGAGGTNRKCLASRIKTYAGADFTAIADGSAGSPSLANDGDTDTGIFWAAANTLAFATGGTERARIQSDGAILIGKTANTDTVTGATIPGNMPGVFTQPDQECLILNREDDDGTLLKFKQANSEEGSVSVSGTTVAYNTFCGTHWSRLTDNSKPTILRGTVMESIATMIDWYQAVADVAESTDNGNVTPAHKVIEDIALPVGKSVGDAVIFTSKGEEYTGVYVKEDNEQLPMCKVSDTSESNAVYGVFMNWDDTENGLDDGVNDMKVAALGAFIVRIHEDETVAIGDYLQSNGDGTAKVQADDIMRASTIGKVTSTEKTHIHADDSYCVPCTLHCG